MPHQFTILLVDDDPHIADILNRAAKRIFPQAHFIHTSSFTEAATYMDQVDGFGPKLILLDLDLQTEMSGFDFLTLVRNHHQGKLVPIIILSINNSEFTAENAYKLGANAFTQKPEDYAGWKLYVKLLKLYWFETVTIPKLWFGQKS